MAIFQESEGGAHAERAIDAALGLFAAADQLNRDNTANPLGLHMGLNSGCALVGSTRMPTGAVDLPSDPRECRATPASRWHPPRQWRRLRPLAPHHTDRARAQESHP